MTKGHIHCLLVFCTFVGPNSHFKFANLILFVFSLIRQRLCGFSEIVFMLYVISCNICSTVENMSHLYISTSIPVDRDTWAVSPVAAVLALST